MSKYRIFTANDKEFLVKADGFKIDKDEGIINFYNYEVILGLRVEKFKACFVLNNTTGVSIIEEENKNGEKT